MLSDSGWALVSQVVVAAGRQLAMLLIHRVANVTHYVEAVKRAHRPGALAQSRVGRSVVHRHDLQLSPSLLEERVRRATHCASAATHGDVQQAIVHDVDRSPPQSMVSGCRRQTGTVFGHLSF